MDVDIVGHWQTYHFEGIELLLNLLSEHWSEPVARGNLSTTIVLRGRPGVMELDAGTEADIPERTLGCGGKTPCARICETGRFSEVI